VEIALLGLAQKHRHGVSGDINWNLAFKSSQHEVTLDASRYLERALVRFSPVAT
jgi:hypothetical protein